MGCSIGCSKHGDCCRQTETMNDFPPKVIGKVEGIIDLDVGGWQGCDSESNAMCLVRRCKYVEVIYLIDEGTPEVKCNRPAGEKWHK